MKIVKLLPILMVFVGISGVFSVLFGAWLAHAGDNFPALQQVRLDTALQYQFIHTLALFITVVWCFSQPMKCLIIACFSFCFGILCFSGSLYLKAYFDLAIIGKLTPFGGGLLALGWLFISFAGFSVTKLKKS